MIENHSICQRISSSIFYGICSCLITMINKIVLTSYGFPSFELVAFGQLVITIFILYTGKYLRLVHIHQLSRQTVNKIMPLPMFFLGNLLFGLASTKNLNLPMFTVLRRFSIWMTMIGEQLVLNVQMSIYIMLIGSLIATSHDLSANSLAYTFIFLNNLSTCANNIILKQKLTLQEVNGNSLLFYNSILSLLPVLVLILLTEDLDKVWNYDGYANVGFVCTFILSSLMGFLLNYASMLCTKYNSPLTTSVIGAFKNIFVTYLGIFIGGDYIYSHMNFIGLTISVVGSVVYSWATFSRKHNLTNEENEKKSFRCLTLSLINRYLRKHRSQLDII